MNKRYIDFVPVKPHEQAEGLPRRVNAMVERRTRVRTATLTEVTGVPQAHAAAARRTTSEAALGHQMATAEHQMAVGLRPQMAAPKVARKAASAKAPKTARKVARGPILDGMRRKPARKNPPKSAKNVSKTPDMVEKAPRKATAVKEAPSETPQTEEILIEETWLEDAALDDIDEVLEKPVSEFADLEHLAEEIAEVTQNEPILEASELEEGESFSLKQEPKFGVVEDFQPRFVKTEVEKRPLSASYAIAAAAQADSEEDISEVKAAKSQMKIPKTQFINQGKVAKRPLSKNVYGDRAAKARAGAARMAGTAGMAGTARMTGVARMAGAAGVKGVSASANAASTVDAADAPVKIVSSGKKGGKIGMFLAVIGTIVLGAVVGTVAFLLLPR